MSNIDYHLAELDIAKNDNDHRNALPTLLPNEGVILDIGCGIGQTFLALNCLNRRCIGIDIDNEAISYGKRLYGNDIEYHLSKAENLPIESDSCDLVICRVSLPYTNIPKAIKEIRRVLKSNGRLWLTIHDLSLAQSYFKEAWLTKTNWKRKLHVSYILINGYCFKFLGIVFPFLTCSYESWQDYKTMTKFLNKKGFRSEVGLNNSIKYIEAEKLF